MAAATTKKEVSSDLPEELWEHIFKFLNDNKSHYFKSLSLVSKHFLSISNCLLRDLKVYDHTLHHLFQRTKIFFIVDCFPLLEELNLTYPDSAMVFDFARDDDIDRLLELSKLYKIIISRIIASIANLLTISTRFPEKNNLDDNDSYLKL
ncbi:F-box protein [Medicago truncatula]|uniref:F-box protein n=1 Tax=Medicago truncatula TaxID=3880 RepID=A0A072UGZ5_MEDTR|nr:F-box protein [Medicago truncatula]